MSYLHHYLKPREPRNEQKLENAQYYTLLVSLIALAGMMEEKFLLGYGNCLVYSGLFSMGKIFMNWPYLRKIFTNPSEN